VTRRPVQQAHANGIRTEHSGVDVRVGLYARHRVQAGDDSVGRVAQRLDARGVLDFVQADDVGVETGQRRQQLDALALELQRLVGIRTPALEVL
jgi:hypothetical protein